MIDLSDWAWLLVAVIWVVLRLLPRLFRAGRGGASAEAAPVEESEPHPSEPYQRTASPPATVITESDAESARPIRPR